MARRGRGTIGRRKGRRGWWVRFWGHDGRRKLRFGGETITQAEAALERLLDEDADQAAAADQRNPLLSEFLDDEYLEVIRGKLSPGGYVAAKGRLVTAAALLPFLMRDVSEAEAEDLFAVLAETRKPGTMKAYRCALSQAWRSAILRGYADADPWPSMRVGKEQEIAIPFLSEQDLVRIYAAMPTLYRPLVVMLGETCARRGEMLSLTWDRVAPDLSTITFGGARDGSGGTKSGAVRAVPVSKRARRVLERIRARRGSIPMHGPDRVFAEIGATWTPWARKAWKAAAATIGHPTLRLHDLRHARASLLVRSGVPIPTVQRWGGWKSPELVLRRYGHHAPTDELARALALSEAAAAASRREDRLERAKRDRA